MCRQALSRPTVRGTAFYLHQGQIERSPDPTGTSELEPHGHMPADGFDRPDYLFRRQYGQSVRFKII